MPVASCPERRDLGMSFSAYVRKTQRGHVPLFLGVKRLALIGNGNKIALYPVVMTILNLVCLEHFFPANVFF
jgi:hypothetical protein